MIKNLLLISALSFSSLANAQVTNGLVAKYSFNNGNAIDEVGTNNGTVSGATLTADRFGNASKAYSFNGTSSYIDLGDSPEFRMAQNDFSISMWVNYTASQEGFIISKRAGASTNYNMYQISVLNSPYFGGASQNLWHFSRPTNGSDRSINVGNLSGAWHHVLMTHDYSDSTSFFVDGQFAGSSLNAVSGVYDIPGHPLVLGYSSESNSFFYNGSIDDVCIYNRALNATEANLLFSEPNPVTVGINEMTNTKTVVNIYPNPNNGQLTIQSKMADIVNITNELGQVVETFELNQQNNFTYKVEQLTNGIYFLVGKTIKEKVIVTK